MNKQTVIVTGAASGIGLACTKLLLARGAQVTAFDIQGDRMAAELPGDDKNLKMVAGDVSDPEICKNVVAETLDQFGQFERYEIAGD